MKVPQIEYARAIAALMVVFFHTEVTLQLEKYFGLSTLKLFLVGDAGVQIFFVVSGFVMHLVHSSDPQRSSAAIKYFLIKRFIRIYLPLWAVLTFLAPVFIFGLAGANFSFWEALSSYLILPSKSSGWLAVEWTLQHEVLFYLLFLIYIYFRRPGLAILILWGFFGSVIGLFFKGPWIIEFLINPNHALFLLGMFLSVSRPVLRKLGPCSSGLMILVGLVIYSLACHFSLEKSLTKTENALVYGIGIFLIFAGSFRYQLRDLGRFWKLIADSSYSLYLIHFPLISALAKIWAVLLPRSSDLSLPIAFGLSVCFCVGAAILFNKMVEKKVISYASNFVPKRVRLA